MKSLGWGRYGDGFIWVRLGGDGLGRLGLRIKVVSWGMIWDVVGVVGVGI